MLPCRLDDDDDDEDCGICGICNTDDGGGVVDVAGMLVSSR
jgi:hypothetical protein